MLPANYCYDIHHNLAVDYLNSQTKIGPCCQSGRYLSNTNELDSIWNDPRLIKLRIDNQKDILDSSICRPCIVAESLGIESRRLSNYKLFNDVNCAGKQILIMDISVGNLCNLKCTTCSPQFSTSWIPDAMLLNEKTVDNSIYKKEYNQTLSLNIDNINLVKDLLMVKIQGGEPFMNERHADILETLDSIGVLQNCRVLYNTNGTHRVSQRVLDLWQKAKLVEIYFSIDDIEKRFELIRFGAKWPEVLDTLEWFRKNMPVNHLFYVMCTISYLNLYYLPELVEWQQAEFKNNRLGDEIPIQFQLANGDLAVKQIPVGFKDAITKRFTYHKLQHLTSFSIGSVNPAVINKLDKLDAIRNTQWRTTLPELAALIDHA